MRKIKRGDIYYADLYPVMGSEQGGIRPVLIIQNDTGNHYSPTVIAAAISSSRRKRSMPTHVALKGKEYGLRGWSMVLLEQIRTIDRCRLLDYIGTLDRDRMEAVDEALTVSVGLGTDRRRQDGRKEDTGSERYFDQQ